MMKPFVLNSESTPLTKKLLNFSRFFSEKTKDYNFLKRTYGVLIKNEIGIYNSKCFWDRKKLLKYGENNYYLFQMFHHSGDLNGSKSFHWRVLFEMNEEFLLFSKNLHGLLQEIPKKISKPVDLSVLLIKTGFIDDQTEIENRIDNTIIGLI